MSPSIIDIIASEENTEVDLRVLDALMECGVAARRIPVRTLLKVR